MAVSFQLASRFTGPTYIRSQLLIPGTVYSSNNVAITPSYIANALAAGDLVFTDGTSLSELQGNVSVLRLCMVAARLYGVTVGAVTGVAAQLRLASTFTTPVSIGQYLFRPGVTYQSADIFMDVRAILDALNRGILVFADSTVVATYLADPVVAALLVNYGRQPNIAEIF